jgi:glutathione synthase/RimK-type ligase-like ATP-grasp enzyme
MKKVLLLRSAKRPGIDPERDLGLFVAGLDKRLNNHQISVGVFSELAFLTDGQNSRIWSPLQGWDLSDFDLVVFRRVGGDMERAISVAHYLHSKKLPFIDEYLLTEGKGKLAGSFLRAAHNIPTPKTFYASPDIFKAIFANDPVFDYPFILKADDGRKGHDNYLINSYEELCEQLDVDDKKEMVAQEYIENDGDLRVLVLAGKVRLAILRKAKPGSHLNNTSADGSAELFSVNKLQPRMIKDCEAAVRLEKLQVAGVDLILDKLTGRHYILEVNRAPQLATGAFVNEKMEQYARMLSEISVKSKIASGRKKGVQYIGRAEYIDFPELGIKHVSAKVDTGADSSSVHTDDLTENKTGLGAKILGAQMHFKPSQYSTIRVENSFGHRENRYKVKLAVRIKGRTIRGTFTLSQRADKTYQVLLGRRILAGKFLVDVKAGSPQVKKERLHSKAIQSELKRARV